MIRGINHLTLAVQDMDRSFAFYKNLLGLQPIQKSPDSAYLVAGKTWLALIQDDQARTGPLPEYTHLAFEVAPGDFEALKQRLERAGTRRWQDNPTEGDSFYFLDPDGHKLEIHASDLQARIESGKRTGGDQTQWFV